PNTGSMAAISVVLPLPERPAMPNTFTESAARLRHDPYDAARSRGKFVAFGLVGDAFQNQPLEFGVVSPRAQGGTQRHLVFLPQAQVQGAIHPDAYAIAALAKVLRHGRDHTKRGDVVRRGPVAGRARAAMGHGGSQIEALCQAG